MSTAKTYTRAEERQIEALEFPPSKVPEDFEELARKLGRSVAGVEKKWYTMRNRRIAEEVAKRRQEHARGEQPQFTIAGVPLDIQFSEPIEPVQASVLEKLSEEIALRVICKMEELAGAPETPRDFVLNVARLIGGMEMRQLTPVLRGMGFGELLEKIGAHLQLVGVQLDEA